jgi:hypothetical protein
MRHASPPTFSNNASALPWPVITHHGFSPISSMHRATASRSPAVHCPPLEPISFVLRYVRLAEFEKVASLPSCSDDASASVESTCIRFWGARLCLRVLGIGKSSSEEDQSVGDARVRFDGCADVLGAEDRHLVLDSCAWDGLLVVRRAGIVWRSSCQSSPAMSRTASKRSKKWFIHNAGVCPCVWEG